MLKWVLELLIEIIPLLVKYRAMDDLVVEGGTTSTKLIKVPYSVKISGKEE